ncbi:RluA family pseudouridine synthase [bacterium]|nr:RluA family pseudouridine synthase [bacterium]
MERRILYEDNHLLAIDKPAGLLSQGDITGDANVVDLLKDYRKRKENKPGEAYVGLVHRLDRPVSGVLVLAKTSKAASRLNHDWATSQVEKLYRAVVTSSDSRVAVPRPESIGFAGDEWTRWKDRLIKDPATNTVRVCGTDESDAKESKTALLEIRLIGQNRNFSDLEIRLGTGRGHQIRVQLASRGLAIVGDAKYGSKRSYPDESGYPRIALHAWRLVIRHPTQKIRLQLTASLPPGWPGKHDSSIVSGFRWLENGPENDKVS